MIAQARAYAASLPINSPARRLYKRLLLLRADLLEGGDHEAEDLLSDMIDRLTDEHQEVEDR